MPATDIRGDARQKTGCGKEAKMGFRLSCGTGQWATAERVGTLEGLSLVLLPP